MSIYDKASLVLIPSGTKTSKLYSQKPVNGDGDFTFSRSTAATRVNADGNIEKETQNLLIQSDWDDVGTGVAPTGWATADPDFEAGASAGQIRFNPTSDRGYIYQTYSIGTGVYALSVYVDSVTTANNVDGVIAVFGSISQSHILWSKDGETISGGTAIEAGHRYTKVFNVTSGGSAVLRIGAGVNGNTTADFTMSRPQLEQGLVARDYIETTTTAVEGGITDNVPRLDYTDASCPALLLEPQRQNRLPHSEYFEGWTKSGATITSNYGESPEGVDNATRIVFSGSTGYVYYPAGTGVGSQTSTMYVKGTSGETILFGKGGNVASGSSFTLDGTWQRLEHTGTDLGSAFHISTYGGSTARDIQVWGAQLEDASYATSYIPTYGSAVTRNAEDLDTTYANAFATNGSVTCYFELDAAPISGSNTTSPNLAQYFTSGDYITYNANGAGRHRIRIWAGGSSSYITGSLSKDSAAKIAVTATSTSASIFINGSLIQSVTIDGDWASANQFNTLLSEAIGVIPLKQYMLFPTALTDQEAIDLTTL